MRKKKSLLLYEKGKCSPQASAGISHVTNMHLLMFKSRLFGVRSRSLYDLYIPSMMMMQKWQPISWDCIFDASNIVIERLSLPLPYSFFFFCALH